jgi:alginate O-acetyltransferase complex protein AlgI
MTFNSLEFFVLMLAFMVIWPWARGRERPRYWAISIASVIFYGWWDWRFVGLLVVSGGIDFVAALLMERRPRARKALVILSVTANLALLGFFKYARWLLGEAAALGGFEVPPDSFVHSIILPVGISFYTFQSMSYTIDVYRGELRATRDPLHFFAYLAMFPQLVAGPIVRAADLLPQLCTPGHFNAVNRWAGLERVALGFLKKCVIADNIAPIVNAAFAVDPELAGAAHWWSAAALFAIQIYCDFSGYSDIAVGIALWMGYSFRENFRHPYVAVGFRSFWSRWHISLSTWFRDYVYIPLGGSRASPVRSSVNLWVTMLLSGLWHGAAWTFVAWGALHAAFLTAERALPQARRLPARIAMWFVTIVGVLWTWIFFRAESITQAWSISERMWGPSGWSDPALRFELGASGALAVGLFVLIEVGAIALGYGAASVPRAPTPVSALRFATVVLALVMCVFLRGPGGEFIYFQF